MVESSNLRREVVLTRILNAPRPLVFSAWTEPDRLARWWGPECFTNPVCEIDLRPGGALRIVMKAPDGAEYPMSGVFQEIMPPERLVFTTAAEDGQGNHVLEGLTAVTFEELDGGTKLTVTSSATGLVDYAEQMLDGMEAGWSQSLNGLQTLVEQGS